MMQRNLMLNTVSILLIAAITSCAQVGAAPNQVAEGDKPFLLTYPNVEDPDGEVVLTNDHVVLQRLVVGAGEWENPQPTGEPLNAADLAYLGG